LNDLITAETEQEKREKIEGIWATRKDVLDYFHFKSVIDLGITVSLNDLPFEKAMIFSWIKGAISVRKT